MRHTLIPLALASVFLLNGSASNILEWTAPDSFPKDPEALVNKPLPLGLGMPKLKGIHHEMLYTAKESSCAIEDGGNGQYESLFHGTYNHHATPILYGDKVLVFWTNHAADENAPGQRVLARWGQLNETRDRIDWGNPEERTFEITPSATPVRRRTAEQPAADADLRYTRGGIEYIDGVLRSAGVLSIRYGWVADMNYRNPGSKPIPDKEFEPFQKAPYDFDMRWDPGPSYIQLWTFNESKKIFEPSTPLYVDKIPPPVLQFTESGKYSWPLPPLLGDFQNAKTFEDAPKEVLDMVKKRDPHARYRTNYKPGTAHLAKNGKNGLAHHAEFYSKNGSKVIIRDNLRDRAFYFAATSKNGEPYPPAEKTNLYGYAQPEAGNFADGRAWIIGNSFRRYDFFLTTSEDGIHFNRNWRIYSCDLKWKPGFGKPEQGGPQYPHALTIGNTVWVFYSIGKQDIVVTRIPVSALDAKDKVEFSESFEDKRLSNRTISNAPEWEVSTSNPKDIAEVSNSRALALTASPNADTQVTATNPSIDIPVGDVITLSFDLKCHGKISGTASNLLFALINTTQNPASNYIASINPWYSTEQSLYKNTSDKLTPNTPVNNYPLTSGKTYHMELEITRVDTSKNALTMHISGGGLEAPVEVDVMDYHKAPSSFNAISFLLQNRGENNRPATLFIQNITITRTQISK